MVSQVDELHKLVELRDMGELSPAEFEQQKRRILDGTSHASPADARPPQAAGGGEREIATFRSSTKGWLLGSFSGLLVMLSVVLGLVLAFRGLSAQNTATDGNTALGKGQLIVGALVCLAAITVVLVKYLRNLVTRYTLTNQRLVVHTGIVLKRTDEIELYRIKDTRVDYSLLNQMAGIGTITILSTDVTTHGQEFVMREIPDARATRETIRGLVEQMRVARGVREMDVDQTRV